MATRRSAASHDRPRAPAVRFERILVPLDIGGRNAAVLSAVEALARDGRARVTLLHVVERIPGLAAQELAAFYRRLGERAERALARTARALAARGVSARVEVRIGEPAREIVRATIGRRVDLVVMGSHRIRPGQRAVGWGTTSYKVGIFCQCPILLVK
jgi:nucleotide-binding universal stress UspA family protein